MKPGYKQTEVGVIPEEWELTQLGTLVEYTKGFAFKSGEYSSQGVRVVRVSDTSYDSILEENAVFVSSSKAHQCAKWRLQKDDLVISTVGSKPPMYDSMVGKVLLVPVEHEGALLNQNAVLIRDKKRRTHFQQILVSHLRTKRYLTWIESIYRGNANQASITLKELFAFPVCYPTGDAEQRDIAAALSDLDALHGALDRLIAKKRDLKQAAMQQLLTGQTRLPGFHAEWNDAQVQDVITGFFCGPSPTCEERNIENEFEWGVLKTTAITKENGWAWKKHKTLPKLFWNKPHLEIKKGDVIVTKAGPRHRVGVTAWVDYVPPRIIVSGKMIGMRPRPDKVVALMLASAIAAREAQTYLDQRTTGMAESQVNFENTALLEAPIRIPRIEEQTAIAEVLTDMDAELTALEQRRAKTRALKQGMMQELLTGRTRLL